MSGADRDELAQLRTEVQQLGQRLDQLAAQVDRMSVQPRPVPHSPRPVPPPQPEPVPVVQHYRPQPATTQPGAIATPRTTNLAVVFSIVGAMICLVGVTLVLLLPADGVLGVWGRCGIAATVSVLASGLAWWQHLREPRNSGAVALMATGIAAGYLTVLGLTVLFRDTAGQALLPGLSGLALACLIGLAGIWVARSWQTQWLAILSVLGSLILSPIVMADDPTIGLVFMVMFTVVTAALQRGLGWVGLQLARMLPTVAVLTLSVAFELVTGSDEISEMVLLILASALALGGLGDCVLHQGGTAAEGTVSAAMMVLATLPLLLVQAGPDGSWSVWAELAGAAIFTAAGLAHRFVPVVKGAALPLGGVLLVVGMMRITEGEYLGSLLFGLAGLYWLLVAVAQFRPVVVAAGLFSGFAVLAWLPVAYASLHFDTAEDFGVAELVQTGLGLIALAAALRAGVVLKVRSRRLVYWLWFGCAGFGSVLLVLGGLQLGGRFGTPEGAYQLAQALVTLGWLAGSVVFLARGLNRGGGGENVRLAVVFASAAVLKLFLLDLATLPDIVRAVAFLGVGALMLSVGVWYHRQLERRRQVPADTASLRPGPVVGRSPLPRPDAGQPSPTDSEVPPASGTRHWPSQDPDALFRRPDAEPPSQEKH